jgi:hypothetical protein
VEEELDKAVDKENQNTWPQHPIPRRRNESRLGEAAHLVKAGQLGPFAFANLYTDALAIVDEKRADETIGNNGTEEPRDGGVAADQDTGTEEGRRQLDIPAPVLNVDGPVCVSTPC